MVNRVCKYLYSPRDAYWSAAKRILRYVCHTTTYALHRPTSCGLLSAFTDVNWTG
jgi:hypothetical protein